MVHSEDDFLQPDPILAEVVVAEDLLAIEASGADGRSGRDGRSYAGASASRGQRGLRGQDATPAQPGQDAGDIEIELRTIGQREDHVQLVGRRVLPGGDERLIRESVAIGDMGFIRLSACGGQGGDGGRGGDGQAGGKGHDGSDATRWRSGEDGGPGGDGGDGGAGTGGGDGGRGGRIVVKVDERDTHLLMLTKYQVSGGRGGLPGTHGRGGAGGAGGDGGRSHSWTTTSTEYYTDAQGQRQSRSVTHHHRNRGGSDGRSGMRGRDGDGTLEPGANGPPGDVRILVQEGTRTNQYLQRYEVEITDYDVQLTDEFAEPTSQVIVSRLTVRNRGGMRTPSRYPVELYLSTSRWLKPQQVVLQLPCPLEPGESSTIPHPLVATVPDIEYVPQDEPLSQTDRVSPLARQTGANRLFDNLHPRREFTVAFPAELDPVHSLESQTTGRAAMFVIGLTNRSHSELGRGSQSQRLLGVRVDLDDPQLAPYIMLLDTNGNRVDWSEGYREEIECLRAGESWSNELIVGVLPGAPGYRRAELKVTLQLGQIDRPGEPRDRHCRLYPVRIAQAYDYDPSADILLVVNHGTTMEELAAWKAAAQRLEQSVAVWDISLNDSLSLSDRLAHGQSLLRDFHGRTIVLPNAPFRTSLGTRYGDQFLSQMDLIKAAESHGIRLLVLNDLQHELGHLFKERLIPTDGKPEYRYESVEALEKAEPMDDVDVLFEQVDELIEHGAQAAGPDPISQTSEVDLYGIRSPNARRLQRQAARLQRRLQNASPGRRVVVTYKLPSELSQEEREQRSDQPPRGGLFFTHEFQGTLTVMPTLGDARPNLVVLDAQQEQVHEPAFIEGEAVSAALTQALDFEEKVYLLSAKLRSLGEQWRVDPEFVNREEIRATEFLVDAILVDLATELGSVLKTPWKGLLGGKLVRNALRQLKLLADHPFQWVSGTVKQPDVQLAARLLAGIEFLGRTSSRWYESRLFPWGFFRRGPVLRKAILRHSAALTENLFHKVSEQQAELVDELVEQYYQRLKKTKRQLRTDKRNAARQVLFAPLSSHGIVTDAGRTFPTVLSYEQWKSIQQAETQREAARVQLRARKEDDRATYGVASDGQPLPSVSPRIAQALQPFVEACAAARRQIRQRTPRRQRAAPVSLPPITETDRGQEQRERLQRQPPVIREEEG